MKITRNQLQEYFAAPLPDISALADAFTFHAFEIESVEGDLLDIKVLPNRAMDCATPEGVARELAAILDMPLKDVVPPEYAGQPSVAVTVARLNEILGSDFTREEVIDVFRRLQFLVEEDGDTIRVTAPLPRTDINIPEDVAEEVAQILGYERIPPNELPPVPNESDQARFRGIERVRDFLVERGFTEISTQSFAKKGDIVLANPLDKTMPALRTNLDDNMELALSRAKQHAPLVLPPDQKPKLFEIGAIFLKDGERLAIKTSEPIPDMPEIKDDPDYVPLRYELGAYRPFSPYPFITRDIALWVPSATDAADLEQLIRMHATELLVRLDRFDRFEKEGKVSYAFRLVFQSMERTLTDDEVNGIMGSVASALSLKGYEVR